MEKELEEIDGRKVQCLFLCPNNETRGNLNTLVLQKEFRRKLGSRVEGN